MDKFNCRICSKSSLVIEPAGWARGFLTWGDTRRGETTRFAVRFKGEFRTCVLLAGVGDPAGMVEVLIEAFFLIMRGSMGVEGTTGALGIPLGVASTVPEGKKDCLVLRGMLDAWWVGKGG